MKNSNATPAHTPRPWIVNRYGQLATPSGETLLVAYGIASPSNGHPRWAEALANRDLIAAAPELLAELRRTVKYVEQYEGTKDDDGETDIVLIGARAAIAKAEARPGFI
jgi:hypothetical protein